MRGGGYRGGAAVAGEVGHLLPVLELLPDGSYRSVLISPKVTGKKREALLAAAQRGEDLDEDQARDVRVIEYEVPDREGDGKDELIALITTITDPRLAPAAVLARAYHQRWSTRRVTSSSRRTCAAPGRCCDRQSPDMVRAGDLGLPADPLRDQRPDLRRGHRSRDRPGPGQVQADGPRHPPGRRPGFPP